MNKEFHIVKSKLNKNLAMCFKKYLKLNKMTQQSFIERKVKEFLIENASFDK